MSTDRDIRLALAPREKVLTRADGDRLYAKKGSGGGGSASWGGITGTLAAQTDLQTALNAKQDTSGKDASGGYAGLTLFKLNMRNVANTFTSFFTNSNTAARTYTLPDKDGTVAMTSDITGTNSGTNTGDVTLAGTPNYLTIAGQVITRALIDLTAHVTGKLPLANLADMATGSLFYRKTAGTGAPEVQTLATLKTDLGLTGTNSGDQTITLTGDVTGTGTGSFAATIAAGAVTLSKMANLTASTILGNNTGVGATPIALTGTQVTAMLDLVGAAKGLMSAGDKTKLDGIATGATANSPDATLLARANHTGTQSISTVLAAATARFFGRITAGGGAGEELTGTQATTLLDPFTSTLKGLVPASGGGTTNFLRADGTWAAPPGGGGSYQSPLWSQLS